MPTHPAKPDPIFEVWSWLAPSSSPIWKEDASLSRLMQYGLAANTRLATWIGTLPPSLQWKLFGPLYCVIVSFWIHGLIWLNIGVIGCVVGETEG